MGGLKVLAICLSDIFCRPGVDSAIASNADLAEDPEEESLADSEQEETDDGQEILRQKVPS